MNQPLSTHVVVKTFFHALRSYFFRIGNYDYSPEIFLRKYPTAFLWLRIAAAGMVCISMAGLILSQISSYFPVLEAVSNLLKLIAFMSISFIFVVPITFYGSPVTKSRAHTIPAKFFRWIDIFRFIRAILWLMVIVQPLLWHYQKSSHLPWIECIKKFIPTIIVAWILLSIFKMSDVIILSGCMTHNIIHQDYQQRILLAKNTSTANQYEPVAIDLVSDEEIISRAATENFLSDYIGDHDIEESNLSYIKVQYLINKISGQIDNLKIVTSFATVLGGYITSQIFSFEYQSVFHHPSQGIFHAFGVKQALGLCFVIVYIALVLFGLSKIQERKNKALALLEDYQKQLVPETSDKPMLVDKPNRILPILPAKGILSRVASKIGFD